MPEGHEVHDKTKVFLIFKKNFHLSAGGAQVIVRTVLQENGFAQALRFMKRQYARSFVAMCIHGSKTKCYYPITFVFNRLIVCNRLSV